MHRLPLPLRFSLVLLCLLPACGKKSGPASWQEIAPGEFQRVAGCGVSIEEARYGKVKGQGMMGEAESREKVFIIRTKFRNFDDTPVKYVPWQTDGSMFGRGDVVLSDDKGTKYKLVQFGMFGKVEGRQKGDVEVKSSDDPLPDLLTFEGKANEAAELYLELPVQWFVATADKSWKVSTTKEKFRFRIPRSAWEGKTDPGAVFAEVAPGQWERSGPVGMTIDEVRVGKVKTEGFPGKGESKDPVLLIRTRFKNFDDKLTIRYIPWQIEAAFAFAHDISLKDDKEKPFQLVVFGLFGSPEGRQKKEVELKPGSAPVSDLLTFESKAAGASVLFLELPVHWQQQQAGAWQTTGKGRFRYRLPRSLWTKAK